MKFKSFERNQTFEMGWSGTTIRLVAWLVLYFHLWWEQFLTDCNETLHGWVSCWNTLKSLSLLSFYLILKFDDLSQRRYHFHTTVPERNCKLYLWEWTHDPKLCSFILIWTLFFSNMFCHSVDLSLIFKTKKYHQCTRFITLSCTCSIKIFSIIIRQLGSDPI